MADDLKVRFHRLLAEGNGKLTASLFTAAELWALVQAGGPPSEPVVHAIGLFASLVGYVIDGQTQHCNGCGEAFAAPADLPKAIIVIEPAVPEPSDGMVFGFCRECLDEHGSRGCIDACWERLDVAFGCRFEPMVTHHQAGHA